MKEKDGLPSDLNIEETTEEDTPSRKVTNYNTEEFTELLKQVQSEYQVGYTFMYPKFVEWNRRQKILNNQIRAKDKIGSTLMFTIHQTILAAMYSDRINVKFAPRTDGDQEQADRWSMLAKYDYAQMDKPELDYDWIYDTLAYSYGLVLVYEWDADTKTPVPITIDPTTFIRDPEAISITGKKNGEGKMRFGGRWIYLTRYQIQEYIDSGVFDGISSVEECKKGSNDTIIEENSRLRKQNMGYQAYDTQSEPLQGANGLYKFLQWFTVTENGELCMVYCAGSDINKIAGFKKLTDSKGKSLKYFPIALRKIHPQSGQWDGYGIFDATEDKQRAVAILENVMLDLAKFTVYSRYVFDNTRIKNKAELEKHEFNQFIPVTGNTAGVIAEIPKAHISSDVSFTMTTLTDEAQRATATSEIQQGVQAAQNRSATENAQVAASVASRYGLNAKVFSWSEKQFWILWRDLYKKHFKGAQKKIVRLTGDTGMTFREITKDDLTMQEDPDVIIESLAVSDAETRSKLQAYSNMYTSTANDPTVDKRNILEKIAQYSDFTEEERNALFPKTIDEYQAEEENRMLNDGDVVNIQADDDDYAHLRIHGKANANPQTEAHRTAHIQALYAKKRNPQAQVNSMAPQPEQAQVGGAQTPPVVDYSQPSTLQTA